MKKSQLKQIIKEIVNEVGIPIGAEKWGTVKTESREDKILKAVVSYAEEIKKLCSNTNRPVVVLSEKIIINIKKLQEYKEKHYGDLNVAESYDEKDVETDVDAELGRGRYKKGCKYCEDHKHDRMMPSHDASPSCESGKKSHCTCDTCY